MRGGGDEPSPAPGGDIYTNDPLNMIIQYSSVNAQLMCSLHRTSEDKHYITARTQPGIAGGRYSVASLGNDYTYTEIEYTSNEEDASQDDVLVYMAFRMEVKIKGSWGIRIIVLDPIARGLTLHTMKNVKPQDTLTNITEIKNIPDRRLKRKNRIDVSGTTESGEVWELAPVGTYSRNIKALFMTNLRGWGGAAVSDDVL